MGIPIGMEIRGSSHRYFRGCGMGMWIEIRSLRHPRHLPFWEGNYTLSILHDCAPCNVFQWRIPTILLGGALLSPVYRPLNRTAASSVASRSRLEGQRRMEKGHPPFHSCPFRSPSRNRIWCILALNSRSWWQQF